MDTPTPETAAGEPTLDELRTAAEETAGKAEAAKAALVDAAVTAAMSSIQYGHLSKVARDAGLDRQVLRDIVNARHPGWLAKAAEQREAEKAAKEAAKGKRESKGRARGDAAAA
ncbi:hypothetical protein [Streptomyces sp. NPDC051546]|uniref:hypothetical protein n=1 Tax=Streptomyces sp. NPDC051546 TaxID=3365655 RepID=UPI00378CC72C